MSTVTYLQEFDVVELRRYAIRAGERENFARYFETYFPEAFQQLGAIAFGEGFERDNATWFSWLRGFRDMPARAEANTAFYTGSVWKEHRDTLNGLMLDSDNVLLLTPLTPRHRVPVLPAVDPVKACDVGRGIVVLQLFAAKPEAVSSFTQHAQAVFAQYRRAGLHDGGVLMTLDEQNNFPALPVREDGPWLAWLGIVEDEAMLDAFNALAGRTLAELRATGWLRDEPEQVVIDPAPRSRLRWLSG